MTGYFLYPVDFGDGNPISSNGWWDAYLLALDINGNFRWVETWGDADNDSGYSVSIDNNNDLYTAGFFMGYVDFGGGNSIETNGSGDAYLLKMDSNGDVIWVESWGGISADEAKSVTVAGNGDVYTTGSFKGTVDFGDGNPITSNGSDDIYLLKLDSNSNFIWVETVGGGGSDAGNSVTINSIGDVYLTGGFYGTVDFGDGNPITSNAYDDGYLMKLDSNGIFGWVKTWGGDYSDRGYSIASYSYSNVYVVGNFCGTVDFGDGNPVTPNGDYDAYIIKFGTN